MNLNELAVEVTEDEGLKESISIAQVKEVLRIILRIIKSMSIVELGALLNRVK